MLQFNNERERARHEPQAIGEISILEMVTTLRRERKIVLIFVILSFLFGVFFAMRMKHPGYVATSIVRIENDKSLLDEFRGNRLQYHVPKYANSQTLNTELKLITSYEIVSKLVDEFGLIEDPRYNERLNVEQANLAQERELVFVSYLKKFTNRHIEPEIQRDARAEVIRNVASLFKTEHEKATLLFKVSAFSPDPNEALRLSNGLSDIYIQSSIDKNIQDAENSAVWLNNKSVEIKEDLDQSLKKVKLFKEQSPLISQERLTKLDAKLKETRARLLETRSQKVTKTDLSAQSLEFINQREQSLSTLEQNLAKAFARQSNDLLELKKLEREVTSNTLLYQSFQERVKQLNLRENMLVPDRRLLQPAELEIASGQSRIGLIAVFSLIGVFVGCVTIFLRETFNASIRSREEFEKNFAVPIFGTVPFEARLEKETDLGFLKEEVDQGYAETIRNLRTSILLSDPNSPPQVVMISSSVPQEGKSVLSASLAYYLSTLSKKTLLIDGDLRKQDLQNLFPDIQLEGKETKTFLDVLQGLKPLEECCFSSQSFGIDILIGGYTELNGADIYATRSFQDLISKAKNQYDFIVLDSPAVLAVPDARSIADQVDCLLYVVECNQTSATVVKEGLDVFEEFGTAVSGVVLTKVK